MYRFNWGLNVTKKSAKILILFEERPFFKEERNRARNLSREVFRDLAASPIKRHQHKEFSKNPLRPSMEGPIPSSTTKKMMRINFLSLTTNHMYIVKDHMGCISMVR
ncbi:hypothetical protein LguiA_032625 [Lonicera macranthoides]